MLLVFTIIFAMLGIYFGFCVENNPYSLTGRIKMGVVNVIKRVFSLLPYRLRTALSQLMNYCFYQPNPIIQIIYVTLVFVLFAIFVFYGVDENYPGCSIDINYVYMGYALCAFCLLCFYWACSNHSGIITKKNHSTILKKYKFDSILYEPGECSKCKLPKIPRSKHCSICDICVDKFDHHCVWINQCVGANNYRYFLLFISVHSILCAYAGGLGLLILYDYVKRNNLLNAQFINRTTNEFVQSSYMTVFKYVIFKNYAFFSAIVMLVTIAITLALFSIYHLYLVNLNLTTNEKSKRNKLVKFMHVVKEGLTGLSKEKGYNIGNFIKVNLKEEEIAKFRNLIFKSPDFDISTLTEEEVNKFLKFTETSAILYKKNAYYKGFINNLKDIIKGV